MGRAPCCSKLGLQRGPWTSKEDALLTHYIQRHGQGNWRSLPQKAGLLRCGKSCRLRWMNYLRPGIKRGDIEPDEEDLIVRLHSLLGNRWSLIAGRLPGRTDNEIKNYWHSHLSKKLLTRGSSFLSRCCCWKSRIVSSNKCDNKNKPAAAAGEEEEKEESITSFKIYTPKPTRIGMIKSKVADDDHVYRSRSRSSSCALPPSKLRTFI